MFSKFFFTVQVYAFLFAVLDQKLFYNLDLLASRGIFINGLKNLSTPHIHTGMDPKVPDPFIAVSHARLSSAHKKIHLDLCTEDTFRCFNGQDFNNINIDSSKTVS
jgi:hypothetical protein